MVDAFRWHSEPPPTFLRLRNIAVYGISEWLQAFCDPRKDVSEELRQVSMLSSHLLNLERKATRTIRMSGG